MSCRIIVAMATLTIDTFPFVDRLMKEGFPKNQAYAIADGLQHAQLDHVATKEDLLNLKAELITWFSSMMIAQIGMTVGLTVALIKLL